MQSLSLPSHPPMHPRRRQASSILSWILKGGGSLFLLGFSLRRLPLADLGASISEVKWMQAIGSILTFGILMTLGESLRLGSASRQNLGPSAPGPLAWSRPYLQSRIWFYLLPAGIAAEAMLWAQTARNGLPAAKGGRIILSVKLWGLSAWLFAAGLGLHGEPRLATLLQGLPPWIRSPLPWFALGTIASLISAFVSASNTRSLRPIHWAFSLAGALGVAGVSIGCAQWAAHAAGIPLSFPAAMGSMALLNFGMTLPLSLGGLGLQEALFLAVLTPLGQAPGPILAMSCLLHLQRLAITAAGGLLFCLPSSPDPESTP